jgi:hypothetical protein
VDLIGVQPSSNIAFCVIFCGAAKKTSTEVLAVAGLFYMHSDFFTSFSTILSLSTSKSIEEFGERVKS